MKNNVSLRIAVTGITGRMGSEIVRFILDKKKCDKNITLGAAITHFDYCNVDVGKIFNNDLLGVIITDNLKEVKNNFDVLIDFTEPNASMQYLRFCVDNNKNIVIGTTGFTKEHRSFILNSSQKIGIVCAANFSIGIVVLLRLLKEITQNMGEYSDINIIEVHHNKKKDTPSGTSLTIRNVIANILLKLLKKNNLNVFNKDLISNIVPIHSIRSGNCIGKHSVLFETARESIELIHNVLNRSVFAEGALHAALWLGTQKVGLFDMNDVV